MQSGRYRGMSALPVPGRGQGWSSGQHALAQARLQIVGVQVELTVPDDAEQLILRDQGAQVLAQTLSGAEVVLRRPLGLGAQVAGPRRQGYWSSSQGSPCDGSRSCD